MKYCSSLALLLTFTAFASGCDAIMDKKSDPTTDEIFEDGRQDPTVIVDVVGYAALAPFWEGFNAPTDIAVGFDEMIYVTDADGVHILDRAGRRFKSFNDNGRMLQPGSVIQDRNLNVFITARINVKVDTLLKNPQVTDTTTWNLACVYVIRNLNTAEAVSVEQILIHPFVDASRASTTSKIARLSKTSPTSDERVELTGVAVLADNSVYVSRRGPLNQLNSISSPDNTVLEMRPATVSGNVLWSNSQQITALNPTVPSLISAVGLSAITTFIAPPQRERMAADRSFLVAQADTTLQVPYRVLWIGAAETPDGLVFSANSSLLTQDTTRAKRFLYETDRFRKPSGMAYAADGSNYIFITDEARDSVYIFQTNGFEGVRAPGAPSTAKPVPASFGGFGSGPRQFKNPSGVAYFRRVVYVADKGNNRIARYKLNTDFE